MILESLSNEPFIRIREPDGRIYERVQDIPAPVSWSAMVEAQHIRWYMSLGKLAHRLECDGHLLKSVIVKNHADYHKMKVHGEI